MAEEPKLVRYDAMVEAIDRCSTVDEVKEIRAKAIALEAYAKVAMNLENETKCARIRIRAERRAGALLREMAKSGERNTGGRPKKPSNDAMVSKSTHKDHGITADQASDWQRLASIPDTQFEEELGKSVFPSSEQILRSVYPKPPEPSPIANLDPKALAFWGRLMDFERYGLLELDPKQLLTTMTEPMYEDIFRLAPVVISWLGRLGEGANGLLDSETELAHPGALQPAGRTKDSGNLS